MIEKAIGDPVAQKLVEWLILRHPDAEANFGRYAAFIAENPNWPSMGPLRRRPGAPMGQEQPAAPAGRRVAGRPPAGRRGGGVALPRLPAPGRPAPAPNP